MSFSIAYWVLMLVWLVLGIFNTWPNWRAGAPNLLLFVLLVLVGWKLFGPPLHD